MATSLLFGLKEKGFGTEQLRVSDPSEARRADLKKFGFKVFECNSEATKGADVVIIAVKPQYVQVVLADLNDAIKQEQLLISIAAGVPITAMRSWLNSAARIIRCMPNTPALKGAGITGMYSEDALSQTETELAATVLGAVGKTLWLESESQLDAVTAVSGSGPAYFFYLTECLLQAGLELGLNASTSKLLATETAYGAAFMMRDNPEEITTLRKNVSSPGGTTEAALNSLQEDKFSETILRAVKSAAQRSVQLGLAMSPDKN